MPHIISASLTKVNSVSRLAYQIFGGFNRKVKTNDEIRLENLLRLIVEAGSEDALAARYNCTDAFIKQMAKVAAATKKPRPPARRFFSPRNYRFAIDNLLALR